MGRAFKNGIVVDGMVTINGIVLDLSALVPTGTVHVFTGFAPPTGFLWARGAAVSRSTYANLLSVLTITQIGTLTNGSAVVTGVTDTTEMRAGAAVEGTGVPTGATILSIDSATQITLSEDATVSGSNTITVFNHGNGNGSTTFTLPDYRGRFPVGTDATIRSGATGGKATWEIDLTSPFDGDFFNSAIQAGGGAGGDYGIYSADTNADNRPPYLAGNFIIKI